MLSPPSLDLARTADCVPHWKRLLFGVVAILLMLETLWSALVLPQAPGRMADASAALIPLFPLWSWAQHMYTLVPRQGTVLALAVLISSVLKFSAYGLAVYLAWQLPATRARLWLIGGVALLLFVVSALALPNSNRDIFNYIISGRVSAVHGANPYAVAVDRFADDPIYIYASQRYTKLLGDNKLPAWMLLNGFLAGLGGDSPIANLLLYRGVFLLFNIASMALVARILLVVRPERRLAGLIVYAWNPIVITYGQSKVDIVMVFFALLAALALVYGRRKLVVVALGVSALVKLITLPLLVAYLLYELRRHGPRALATSLLLLLLTAVLFFLPFWYGPGLLLAQLALLQNAGSGGSSLFQILACLGFALAVLWIGLRRDERLSALLGGWALLMVLFAIFLTKLGFSWYLLTMIALTAIAAERRLALITLLISWVAFLMNAWDTASNEVLRLPQISQLPRLVVYLLFVLAAGASLAALEFVRRARQRYSS